MNWQKKFWGLQLWIWISLIAFYFFFGTAYHMAIYLTSQGQGGWAPNTVLDYLLKGLLTIPIWWLIFRKFDHWPLHKKLWIHVIGLPLWTIVWQQSYYWISDALEMGRLRGSGTWWDIYIPGLFYVLQFGIFHVYDFYIRLMDQYTLEQDLRNSALQSELTALKAQLNPHFLYNIFNTINASVPAEQEKTREMIASLSDLFRYQLQGSKVEMVTFKDEITFVKKYLELEKARFGDRLQIEYDIDEIALQVEVPPMILQPIVENAVKHGLAPKIEGGTIIITAKAQDAHIAIEVCDTGVGFMGDSPEKRGVGLTNTAMRLEKMYQSELSIQKRPGGGVCVRFSIPVE